MAYVMVTPLEWQIIEALSFIPHFCNFSPLHIFYEKNELLCEGGKYDV